MEQPTHTDRAISELYAKYHTPVHVRAHCAVVAALSCELGEKLQSKGIEVDIELLRAAALLHDLVRVVDFRTFNPEKFPHKPTEEDIKVWIALREKYKGWHHAKAAEDILKKDYPEVAKLVGTHLFLQIEKGFDSWEEKLLYYADKRVKHDLIVDLKERLEDGRKRNVPDMVSSEESESLDKKVLELEREILELSS